MSTSAVGLRYVQASSKVNLRLFEETSVQETRELEYVLILWESVTPCDSVS